MSTSRNISHLIAAIFLSVIGAFSAEITVSKSGSADYTSIQAAINAAQPGDVVKITDNAVYNEQITIDKTKYSIRLVSKDPTSLAKPTIKFQDTINVGPRTAHDANVDSLITYDKNGALRIIEARNVIIDGIAIDGGGSYPFGYPNIWNGRSAYQSGNGGIVIYKSGDAIIRNCDIANAYFGIVINDENWQGIFSNYVPSDFNDTSLYIPMSDYGKTGNHLIERNRIHDNSWGIFFNAAWDLGSTVRYNLIYENHHMNDSIASVVKNLTDIGSSHAGGAFFFEDIILSPLAVYNNTFYHNFLIFAGFWQAGYQHLAFNNIFGPPYKYVENSTPQFNTTILELTPVLAHRLSHCVFSAQAQAPQSDYVEVMDSLPLLTGTDGMLPDPGTMIIGANTQKPFPESAVNRWLEMDSSKFLSMDPASKHFLEPKWSDSSVAEFIAQKGWQAVGVKNTDGTWADLGAIEQAHGTPSFVGTIRPSPLPIMVNGATAQIFFSLNEREGTTMNDPTITLFRLVKTQFERDTYGSSSRILFISSNDMASLPVPATPPVKVGLNSYSITATVASEFAFIEMIVEATGPDGKRFNTAGFLPYRKLLYMFKVEVLDNSSLAAITETHVGDTVTLKLTPQKIDGTAFTNQVKPVLVTLQSGFELLTPGNPAVPLTYPNGIAGGADSKLVIVTKIPEGGFENILASGTWWNSSTGASPLSFLGGTSIKVLPDPSAVRTPKNPITSQHGGIPLYETAVKCFDLQGRMIFHKTFFSYNGLAFSLSHMQMILPGTASKVYLMDISVKDKLSQKQGRSVRKVMVR